MLDEDTLASLGIELSKEKTEELIKYFNETLQERVGLEIFDALDDNETAELLELQEKGDEQAVAKYIEQHVPDFKEIVEDETDILLGELADDADSFTAE